jgi:hypothetical protein
MEHQRPFLPVVGYEATFGEGMEQMLQSADITFRAVSGPRSSIGFLR